MRLYCHLNGLIVFLYGKMNTLINLRKKPTSKLFAEKNRLHCQYMVNTCTLLRYRVCLIEFSRKQWKIYANLSVVCLHTDKVRSFNRILHSIDIVLTHFQWNNPSQTLIPLPYQYYFTMNTDSNSHLTIGDFTFTFIWEICGVFFFKIIFRHRLNRIFVIACQK